MPWPTPNQTSSTSASAGSRTRRSTPTTTSTRTTDALTKFLPKEYKDAIKYIDVDGRTKLAIRDHISQYIPNPTFARVAVPGGWGNTAANKGEGGKSVARRRQAARRCPASTRSSTPSRAWR